MMRVHERWLRKVGALAGLLLLGAVPLRAQDAIAVGDLPPVGYGSFNQDQLSVRFGAQDLEIRFLPLDERLLRLLAKDAYASLHGLVEERQVSIDSVARAEGIAAPGLVLVSFFALRRDARFEPGNLNLLYRNQLERPAAILPYTANFTSRQLGVRQQASAIYVFAQPIPVFEEFGITYNGTTSNAWNQALSRIQRERSRVLARWQTERERGNRGADTVSVKP
jgi:hypothetical protein